MMTKREEEKVANLLREFEPICSGRGIWEGHWEQVSQKVLPYYSSSFYSQGNTFWDTCSQWPSQIPRPEQIGSNSRRRLATFSSSRFVIMA